MRSRADTRGAGQDTEPAALVEAADVDRRAVAAGYRQAVRRQGGDRVDTLDTGADPYRAAAHGDGVEPGYVDDQSGRGGVAATTVPAAAYREGYVVVLRELEGQGDVRGADAVRDSLRVDDVELLEVGCLATV